MLAEAMLCACEVREDEREDEREAEEDVGRGREAEEKIKRIQSRK